MTAMTGHRRVTALAARSGMRLRRLQSHAPVLDAVLGAGFGAAMVIEHVTQSGRIGDRMPAGLALSAVLAAALAMRRRAPLTAYLISSAAMLLEARFIFTSGISPNANLIQIYSMGLYATPGRARLGPAISVAGSLVYFAPITGSALANVIATQILWLLAWAFGYGTARRQEERETARALLRQQVVSDERAHIARELHDLVGHSLNVMLVQAGAARRVLDRNPEQTRELLASLENTGRDAFDELDRVLGLLHRREPDPRASSAPSIEPAVHPGLADLSRLTERLAQAGIQITLTIDDDAHAVPRSIDMSAYRIVQEALTNTVKHARADSADVTVVHQGQCLDIEVRDDGQGVAGGYATGRGLLGIGERVSMFGGQVEHGGGERGGFRLHAVIPIPQ